MTTLQLVHWWVSMLSGVALVTACCCLVAGLLHPIRSKRGDKIVKFSVAGLIIVVVIYLVYAATVITTIAVMRS